MLAGVVHRLGLHGGTAGSRIVPDAHNPGGYWEQRPIVRVHDDLLRAAGGWASAPPEPADCGPTDAAERAIQGVVDELFEPERSFYLKDPRQCLLLDAWRAARPAGDVSVLIARHPSAVTSSLQRRNRYSHDLTEALWLRYLTAALRSLAGHPCYVVSYEELVARPEEQIGRLAAHIADALDLPQVAESQRLETAISSVRSPRSEGDQPEPSPFSRSIDEVLDFIRSNAGSHDALPSNGGWSIPEQAEAVIAKRRRKMRLLLPLWTARRSLAAVRARSTKRAPAAIA